jgi:hypothetical protein
MRYFINYTAVVLSSWVMSSCRFSQVQSPEPQNKNSQQFFLTQNEPVVEFLEESDEEGTAFVFNIVKAQEQLNNRKCLGFDPATSTLNNLKLCNEIEREHKGFDIVALDRGGSKPLSDERFAFKNSHAQEKCLSAGIDQNKKLFMDFKSCDYKNPMQNWLILPFSRISTIESTPLRSVILAIKLSLGNDQDKIIYCISATDQDALELKPCSSDQVAEQHFYLQAAER